jgi:hypothetical protein
MSPNYTSIETEIVDAYTASIRLRLYARVAVLLGAVAFVAVLGAMIVGWLGTGAGSVLLAESALLTTATAAKLYDQSTRTSVSAAGLERSVSPDKDLYASVPETRQKVKTVSGVVGLVAAVVVVGVLAYSFQNAGTETDDDDDDRTEISRPDSGDDDKEDKDD